VPARGCNRNPSLFLAVLESVRALLHNPPAMTKEKLVAGKK